MSKKIQRNKKKEKIKFNNNIYFYIVIVGLGLIIAYLIGGQKGNLLQGNNEIDAPLTITPSSESTAGVKNGTTQEKVKRIPVTLSSRGTIYYCLPDYVDSVVTADKLVADENKDIEDETSDYLKDCLAKCDKYKESAINNCNTEVSSDIRVECVKIAFEYSHKCVETCGDIAKENQKALFNYTIPYATSLNNLLLKYCTLSK